MNYEKNEKLASAKKLVLFESHTKRRTRLQ